MSIFCVLCIKKKVIVFDFTIFLTFRYFPFQRATFFICVLVTFFLIIFAFSFLAFLFFLFCIPLIYQYCLLIALLVHPYFHSLSLFIAPPPLTSPSPFFIIFLYDLSIPVPSSPCHLLISLSVLHDPPMGSSSPLYILIYISLHLFDLNLFFSSHLSIQFFPFYLYIHLSLSVIILRFSAFSLFFKTFLCSSSLLSLVFYSASFPFLFCFFFIFLSALSFLTLIPSFLSILFISFD